MDDSTGGPMQMQVLSLSLFLVAGCSMLPFNKQETRVMPPPLTDLEKSVMECMTVQTCDEAGVFPTETWNLAEQTEVARLMKAADRFNFDRAAQCIGAFDRQLNNYLTDSRQATPYTPEDVKTKRGVCVVMYHRLMQSLILAEEPLETVVKRWSRAQLVLTYTEQLAVMKIPPVEVKIQPRDLVKAYQKGVLEDLVAVKAKRWGTAELCRVIATTDKTPPHNLPKPEVDRLQCSTTNTAVQNTPR